MKMDVLSYCKVAQFKTAHCWRLVGDVGLVVDQYTRSQPSVSDYGPIGQVHYSAGGTQEPHSLLATVKRRG